MSCGKARPTPANASTTRTAIRARMPSVYMAVSARTALRGIRCRAVQYPFQGSARSRTSRDGTVRIAHRDGSSEADNSAHVTGTDTGAVGFARVEKAAIEVFVRLLRR